MYNLLDITEEESEWKQEIDEWDKRQEMLRWFWFNLTSAERWEWKQMFNNNNE